MTTYKLHYFDIRGRGECIRLLFMLKDQAFEDIRYNFEEWPETKKTISKSFYSKIFWLQSLRYIVIIRCTSSLDAPNGQLPFLEIDDDVICQSRAIGRMLAKKFGKLT